MFFSYCVIINRSSEEFWNARPSQVKYVINRYIEYKNNVSHVQEEITEIHSMSEIPGWGCHGR